MRTWLRSPCHLHPALRSPRPPTRKDHHDRSDPPPRHRGRPRRPPGAGTRPHLRRLRGEHRQRRLRGTGQGARRATRCHRPRRDDAPHRRARGVPAPQGQGRHHPHPRAHRPGHGGRPGGRARRRCRRLPGQAVRPRRAASSHPGSVAQVVGLDHRRLQGRRPRGERCHPRGHQGRRACDTHQDRVRPARPADGERRASPQPGGDLRAHLGLRLRDQLELARRLRGISAPQDRAGGKPSTHPHGARCRIRHPRPKP